jgi:hypothetical protein
LNINALPWEGSHALRLRLGGWLIINWRTGE